MKDVPILKIKENGTCTILDFARLPFALRKEDITFADFIEWASSRTLSIGRSYAKEILNTMRLSQSNRYTVCKACRGVSLEDSYWLRQDGDEKTWKDVNLFENPFSLFITEISLSGRSVHYKEKMHLKEEIHTPELTTLGASAKGWIRHKDGIHLHKVGRYEAPAAEILSAIGIEHMEYQISTEEEISSYLSAERREWIESVGEKIVNSRLFTSEETAFVTFEEFKLFCASYGLNPYEEAVKIDRKAYLQMQIADYLLNNNDRHEQNWGFLMENETGKITGYCPLFDHDHAFSAYPDVVSQTTEKMCTLEEAGRAAQKELKMDLGRMDKMEKPCLLTREQWEQVLERKERLCGE